MLSRSRHAVILVAALALGVLALSAASAEAIIPQSSQITTPSALTFPLSNIAAEGPAIPISGTSAGMTEGVDIRCYYATTGSRLMVKEVPVSEAGDFSTSAPRINFTTSPQLCRLRAVPKGTTPAAAPGEEGVFRGPLVAPANFSLSPTFLRATTTSLSAYMFIQQAEGCGLESHLVGASTLEATNYVFYCNGGLVDRTIRAADGDAHRRGAGIRPVCRQRTRRHADRRAADNDRPQVV